MGAIVGTRGMGVVITGPFVKVVELIFRIFSGHLFVNMFWCYSRGMSTPRSAASAVPAASSNSEEPLQHSLYDYVTESDAPVSREQAVAAVDDDGGADFRDDLFHHVGREHVNMMCEMNLRLADGAITGSPLHDAHAHSPPVPIRPYGYGQA